MESVLSGLVDAVHISGGVSSLIGLLLQGITCPQSPIQCKNRVRPRDRSHWRESHEDVEDQRKLCLDFKSIAK